MESLKILLLSVAAAVLYGILQDQVTARVCVEYFTVGHPPVFHTDDPTTLAFGWGVIATWWVGLGVGVPLVLFARLGRPPKVTARRLLKPVAVLLGCVGLAAFVAGVMGFLSARAAWVSLVGPLADRVPPEKHVAFLADGFAHSAAYAAGFLGGVMLWAWTWRCRRKEGGVSSGQLGRTFDLPPR
jgi:hypothetical protein